MEQWASVVLQRGKTLLDTSKIQQTRILGVKAQGQLLDAIQIGLQVLRSLGIEFPEQPTQEDIGQAFGVTRSLWAGKAPRSLLDLPTMRDLNLLAAMEILTTLVPAAYVAAPTLMPLLIFKQVELSIQSGNCSISVFAYSDYGLILCGIIGDIENGYEFGELALSLLEKLQLPSLKSRSWCVVHHFIKHWKTPLSEILPALQEAYHSGLETGDIEAACLSASSYCYDAYYVGQELTELLQTMDAYRQTIHQYKQAAPLSYQEIYQQAVLNLLGQSEVPYLLSGAIFNPKISLPQLQYTNGRASLFIWYFNQTILYYLFQKDAEAAQTSTQTAQYLDGILATFLVPLYSFYDALIQLTQYAEASPEACQVILLQVQQHQDQLHHWATLAPTNHQHRWELVRAEQYRVLGSKTDAIEAYDRAIQLAHENGFIQDEALANELVAKFYLDWGKEKVAAGYMQEAYYCYARWGAKAKTDDLEKRYSQLLTPILQSATRPSLKETLTTIQATVSNSGSSISSLLDLDAILKISQSFTSEIRLERLVEQVMQAVVSTAGADKGVLILNHEGRLEVVSQYINSQVHPFEVQPIESCFELPISIVHYVARTLEVTIASVEIPHIFTADPYFSQHSPQSLLCTPIFKQGHLIGLLYLENSLTSLAFTSDRLSILNLLCTQAAISLENATLYNTLEHKVIERTRELSKALNDLKAAQKKLVESEKMAALGGLVAGVAHEINTPLGVGITLASSLAQETKSFKAVIAQGQLKKSVLTSYLDTAEDCSNLMLTNLQRAGELIQSFKQVAVDQSNLEQRQIPLKSYINDILTSLSPKLRQAGHNLTVTGDDTIEVFSYPGAIAQLLVNFLNNSLIHAYPTGKPGQLAIHVTQTEEDVTLVYSDDGCGIPTVALGKIFEPFFTTARDRGGSGLGLHIVYNLVTQKLGGAIDVESQVGKGTLFTIKLPRLPYSNPK